MAGMVALGGYQGSKKGAVSRLRLSHGGDTCLERWVAVAQVAGEFKILDDVRCQRAGAGSAPNLCGV